MENRFDLSVMDVNSLVLYFFLVFYGLFFLHFNSLCLFISLKLERYSWNRMNTRIIRFSCHQECL